MAAIDDESSKPKSAAQQVEDLATRWFISGIGLVYAIGFLVALNFFKSYGISEISFVEARYIYVGSFFLIACIVILLPLAWIPYCKFSLKGFPHTTIPTIVGAALMLFIFFLLIAFAPHNFFHQHWTEIVLNLALSPLLLLTGIAVDYFNKKRKLSKCSATVKFTRVEKGVVLGLQITLVLFQLIVVIRTIEDLNVLSIMWSEQKGSLMFFACVMMITFIYGARLIYRLPQALTRSQEFNLVISNGCIIALFLYMAVWTFSRSMYPYIPSSRGGGDFTDEMPIHLLFKPLFSTSESHAVKIADDSTNLILLDENSTSFFVANKTNAGGVLSWRNTNKPIVYEVSRDVILEVSHDNKMR